MSGHSRSIIPQQGGVSPIDNNTVFYAPFDEDAKDIVQGTQPIGELRTTSFDGVDDYLDLGNFNLASLTDCTIEFWHKTSSSLSWLLFQGQTTSYYIMAISPSGDFYHRYNNVTPTIPITIYKDGEITTKLTRDGQWHHYAATGVDLSAWTNVKVSNYPGFHIHGSMENLRIWNRSLSQNEIKELQQGNSKSTKANLHAQWRLGEEGMIAYDYSCNGHDGVIYGATSSGGRATYSLVKDGYSEGAIEAQRKRKSYGGGILIEEETSNLVPNPEINSYPTFGNGWGTYQTNQYNSNTSFSIGTVESVVNNIVTLNPIGREIYTYDVLNADTTGGGVTAGTEYFIKKHSSNSFSLHAYDSSQDGSKGFRVHDSIKNDVRISINATDFPTMWHGGAHRPNSGLVKEVIKNGFNHEGRVHDCLRLYTDHKTEGTVNDYLAYGITPPIVAGLTYTVSLYHKATTIEAIGRNVGLSFHTAGTSFGGGSFNLGPDWQRHTTTFTAPTTGGTNFYINAGSGVVWDLAEIQIEEKSYATPFVGGTRERTNLAYSIPNTNPDSFTVNFWAKFNGLRNLQPLYINICDQKYDDTNRFYLRPHNNETISGGFVVEGVIHSLGNAVISTPTLTNWGMYSFTSDGTTWSLYINGVLTKQITAPIVVPFQLNYLSFIENAHMESVALDELRIDKVARTGAEILAWYYQGRNGW